MKLNVLFPFGWICIAASLGFITCTQAYGRPNTPSYYRPPSSVPSYNNNFDTQRIVRQWKTEETNKQIVRNFIQGLFGDKDLSVIDKYVDPVTYIQHFPTLADGIGPLKESMKKQFPPGSPKTQIEFLKIGADGEFVYVHNRSTRNNNPLSVMHIYKVANGKLVEHWEVREELTPELLAASKNDHPLF